MKLKYKGMTEKQKDKWLKGMREWVGVNPKIEDGDTRAAIRRKEKLQAKDAEAREMELQQKLAQLDARKIIGDLEFPYNKVVEVEDDHELMPKLRVFIKNKTLEEVGAK